MRSCQTRNAHRCEDELANVLAYYSAHSEMSNPGHYAGLLERLPADPVELARIIQGLMIYEHVAADFYGVELAAERRAESHIRRVERMLERLLMLDGRPLEQARVPAHRLVGICRHFSLMLVSMLRQHGIPARTRSGFGTYFNPGYLEGHWICEYWHESEKRWVIADPQFDQIWRSQLHIDHDVNDVPRDCFVSAADVWKKCREGSLDPANCGIFFGNLRGLWFVAGSLIRDAAALNKIELLPWDLWGVQPQPDWSPADGELTFFDRLAGLLAAPEAQFEELRAMLDSDVRVRVPTKVFNSLRQRHELAS